LAQLLRGTQAAIRLNEHIAEDGPIVFEHVSLAPKASFSNK
jgi:hypothetical protein